ncbi:MAG: hypothetical protein JRC90_09410 [Deltaproteobacteria bacterium]|nr:hypothetical protein [Deltaproteobacteria bacterium]
MKHLRICGGAPGTSYNAWQFTIFCSTVGFLLALLCDKNSPVVCAICGTFIEAAGVTRVSGFSI